MNNKYIIQPDKPTFNSNQIICILFFIVGLSNTSGGALIYDAACLGMFFVATVICMLDNKTCSAICTDFKVCALVVVLIYTTAHAFPVAGISHTFKQVVYMLFLYSPIFMFHYFKQPQHKAILKTVLVISYSFIMFYCVYSLVFYAIFPGTARYAREHAALIGGGYGLSCAVSIFSCFLFGLLVNGFFKSNKKLRLGVIVSIIIMFLTVYRTESTLTLIILVVGYACCLYFKNNNKAFFQFRLFLLPIAIVLAIILLPQIGEFLIDISEARANDNRMFKRLFSAGNFLVYGIDNDESLYAVSRFLIPFETLKTFFKNPLFGVAYKHGCGYLRPYLFGVGNHCEFVDALANFGIFGGGAFLSIYGLQIREILKYKIDPSKMWVVVVILLGTFNPLRYFQVNFVLFFLMPIFCLYFKERLAEQNTEENK